MQTGKVDVAEQLFKQVIERQPKHIAALNIFSIFLTRLERYQEAEHYVRLALNEDATSDASFYNYGVILKALKRPLDALRQFNRALQINPSVAETWNNRGTVFNDLKRYREAIADFDRAIAANANYADAFFNKGNALAELKSHEESLIAYDMALALKRDLAGAWVGRGNALTELERNDDAFAAYDKAVALKPDLAEAWLGRGNLFAGIKRYDDALAAYDRALALKPDLAKVWLGCGNVATALKQSDKAFSAFDKALALQPDLAEAWLGRGNVLLQLKQHNDARAAYDTALAMNADLEKAWIGRGNVAAELMEFDDAFAAYDRALALKPDGKYVRGDRLHAKLQLSDWTGLEAEVAALVSAVRERKPAITPFPFLSISSSPSEQLECTKCFIADQSSFPAIWRGEIYSHDRIRVAYLSADFRNHPVAQLAVGLFEHHDKSRFETTAISFGPDDGSQMRGRIKSAFDNFLDVRPMGDFDIASQIRRREIDIVVDLMGFTRDNRFNILAWRAAPIQVNFLGYPGTMAADYIDYIVADRTIIPENHFPFYGEQVVWLPDSYQANDEKRQISERRPTRHECALPETAFVFCCFNNTYKITPEIFDIWMRLLGAIDDSVLWLIETNATAAENLRREAEKRGVASQRLIFAPRMPPADHLARCGQADIFLDTLPYNAHTTASDALWTGVPVLTCLGTSFAGRVAGSLLRAVGLDEMITHSLQEYESLALSLAQNPRQLASVKDKLARNRNTFPLFDAERFTRHMEQAFVKMWERYQSGEMPASLGQRAPIQIR